MTNNCCDKHVRSYVLFRNTYQLQYVEGMYASYGRHVMVDWCRRKIKTSAMGSGWLHSALWCHKLMPISCQFRDRKSALLAISCKKCYSKYWTFHLSPITDKLVVSEWWDMLFCCYCDVSARLIGRLEVEPNADLSQVRSDIDQLIMVYWLICSFSSLHILHISLAHGV